MMKRNIESFLNDIIRTPMEAFSIRELQNVLEKKRVKVSAAEIASYLHAHPLVVSLEKDKYVTRAGLFTGYVFSFKPTKYEIDNGFFVPGHRCIPFTDPDMLPHELTFRYNHAVIPATVCEVQTSEILPMYSLFGEEFVPQYIAFDPANKDSDFSLCDFELPARLQLSVPDMKEIYRTHAFCHGDRLICRIHDWSTGVIDITVLSEKKENPFEETAAEQIRSHWFDTAESALLASFEKYGPCESIEKQLMYMYLLKHKELCVPECGSPEELLARTKKITLEYYGVESRLWYKDTDIPAIGPWNSNMEYTPPDEEEDLDGVIPLPGSIIHAFILDSLYRKEPDCSALLNRILPDQEWVSEYDRVLLMLHLMQKRDIVRKQYNWFADFEPGKLRQKALEVYTRLFSLVCDLDSNHIDVSKLPQQPLVVLSQLCGHISRLITSFSGDIPVSEKDLASMRLSLEGMEISFEESEAVLRSELKKHGKDAFFVVKETGTPEE